MPRFPSAVRKNPPCRKGPPEAAQGGRCRRVLCLPPPPPAGVCGHQEPPRADAATGLISDATAGAQLTDKTALLTNVYLVCIINLRGEDMKRRDLIKLLEKNGWYYKRSGGDHDIYTDGKSIEPISRQKEIKEAVAQAIIRRRGLK